MGGACQPATTLHGPSPAAATPASLCRVSESKEPARPQPWFADRLGSLRRAPSPSSPGYDSTNSSAAYQGVELMGKYQGRGRWVHTGGQGHVEENFPQRERGPGHARLAGPPLPQPCRLVFT